MVPLLKTAANVVELIAETPLVREALAQRSAAIALQRSVQIKELARLQREAMKSFPALEAALQAAVTAVKDADRAALEARRRFDRAAGEKAEAAYRYTGAVDRLEDQLRKTASPAIKEFVSEMLTALDETRKAAAWSTTHEVNEVTGAGRTTTANNLKSLSARIDAVREAIRIAEELALSEADQSVVPAKLAELRAALPIIDAELK
jgi:hypothetical protein